MERPLFLPQYVSAAPAIAPSPCDLPSINITANRLVDESSVKKEEVYEQLDLFTDYEAQRKKQEEEAAVLDREKRMQEAMLSIKKKFGKNAVLKGMNLQEGATARDRNEQIGGHRA